VAPKRLKSSSSGEQDNNQLILKLWDKDLLLLFDVKKNDFFDGSLIDSGDDELPMGSSNNESEMGIGVDVSMINSSDNESIK